VRLPAGATHTLGEVCLDNRPGEGVALRAMDDEEFVDRVQLAHGAIDAGVPYSDPVGGGAEAAIDGPSSAMSAEAEGADLLVALEPVAQPVVLGGDHAGYFGIGLLRVPLGVDTCTCEFAVHRIDDETDDALERKRRTHRVELRRQPEPVRHDDDRRRGLAGRRQMQAGAMFDQTW